MARSRADRRPRQSASRSRSSIESAASSGTGSRSWPNSTMSRARRRSPRRWFAIVIRHAPSPNEASLSGCWSRPVRRALSVVTSTSWTRSSAATLSRSRRGSGQRSRGSIWAGRRGRRAARRPPRWCGDCGTTPRQRLAPSNAIAVASSLERGRRAPPTMPAVVVACGVG
jgi:hypothetical protein